MSTSSLTSTCQHIIYTVWQVVRNHIAPDYPLDYACKFPNLSTKNFP